MTEDVEREVGQGKESAVGPKRPPTRSTSKQREQLKDKLPKLPGNHHEAYLNFDHVDLVYLGKAETVDNNGFPGGFGITYAVLIRDELVGFLDASFSRLEGMEVSYNVPLSKLVHTRLCWNRKKREDRQ